jgi:hypothetical protein
MVGSGDVHHAIHHNRRDFELAGIAAMEYPLRTKLPNISRSDLRKTAVASSGVIAIVRRPILLNLVGKQLRWLHTHIRCLTPALADTEQQR